MRICLIVVLAAFLSACQTTEHFVSQDSELAEWGFDRHFRQLKEPSLFEYKDEQSDQYRLIVFSGVSPIHAIRVKGREGKAGRLIFSRLDGGYRLAKRPTHKTSRRKTIREAQMTAFLNVLDKQDVLSFEGSIMLEGICLHPTIFLFEAVQDGNYNDYLMSVCSLTIEGVTMVKAFYELAGIDAADDWSMTEYFSDVWKKPEYQDLLAAE